MRSVWMTAGMVIAAAALALAPASGFAKDKADKGAASSSSGNSGNSGNGNGGGSSSGGSSSGTSGGTTTATPPACGLNDISITAVACSGFFQGNLLNNSPADVAAQTSALAAIGLTAWDGGLFVPQLSLTTSTVNFASALNGLTFIGLHFGAGASSPSPQTRGGVTGFYRLDAGTNLDTFTLAFGSASGARLYVTQAPPVAPLVLPPVSAPQGASPPPAFVIDAPFVQQAQSAPSFVEQAAEGALGAVPEPGVWTMMILGFGAVGGLLRRQRRLAARA